LRARERLKELEERLQRLQMLNKKLGQLQSTSRVATSVMPEMWAKSRGEEYYHEAGAPSTYPPPVHRQHTYGGTGLSDSMPHMQPRRAWTMQAGGVAAAMGGMEYDSMVVGTPGPHDAMAFHSQTAGGSRRPSTFQRPITPGGCQIRSFRLSIDSIPSHENTHTHTHMQRCVQKHADISA